MYNSVLLYMTIEQQATGLLRPVVEQSTMCTRMQLQEELDDSLLVC